MNTHAFSAGAPPQTPLVELTALPRPPSSVKRKGKEGKEREKVQGMGAERQERGRGDESLKFKNPLNMTCDITTTPRSKPVHPYRVTVRIHHPNARMCPLAVFRLATALAVDNSSKKEEK